ncbi:AAA family ATPase [Fluviispira vulneris]|uniref:AAA family ATPase n=1 Tax=Fluviispira vulneris TaxID=2763012 RepID=UPI001646EE6A|nr:AAA family ATPase [Fluviispira vulneris]
MIIADKKEKGLLSERLRPSLAKQNYLLGSAKKIWERDLQQWRNSHKFHIILWGPPGSGKTTLARMLGEDSGIPFVTLSAVRDGVKEIKNAVEKHPGALIFIDEIHRLSRNQQDILLPILEYSEAWIIGATTESPTTELSPPILSRVRSIYISPLNEQEISQGLLHGYDFLKNNDNDFQNKFVDEIKVKEQFIPKISQMSGGDLRFALNLFENIIYCNNEEEENDIFKNSLKAFTNKNHYDFISAMIKSMRGSDPDAALFYAITALDKGEDPIFIARRCVIFASEDVGNADPQALSLAVNAYKAIECVGMPEGRIPLAQVVTYLASTMKSNKAYLAIERVRKWRIQAEENGYSLQPPNEITIKGKNQYKYPHNFENSFVYFDYLPKEISRIKQKERVAAYLPSDYGTELRLKNRLAELWKKPSKIDNF